MTRTRQTGTLVRMGRQGSSTAKQRILHAALERFNQDGIRPVSADAIIERANVAKMTFYKYFPTKDDLAAAYVHKRSDIWIAWLRSRVSELGRTQTQRLLALFDALAEWYVSSDYRGCPFHRSAAEFNRLDNPIHQEVIRNKHQLRIFLIELIKAAGASKRRQLANQLIILMSGATTMRDVEGPLRFAQDARRVAALLLRTK